MNEFLDIPYPMADNMTDLDTLIDERINSLIKKVFQETSPSLSRTTQRGSSGGSGAADDRIKTGQVMIQFYDVMKKQKRKSGWFGLTKEENEEQKIWESWIINVNCIPIDEKSSGNGGNNQQLLQQQSNNDGDTNSRSSAIDISITSFEENLHTIIDIADAHKDHIPPIMSLESSPFPYSIDVGETISRGANYTTTEEESWGKYIKKMLD